MKHFVYSLVISLLLGAFIGIERQIHENTEWNSSAKTSLGLRTFALVTTLGTISGFLQLS